MNEPHDYITWTDVSYMYAPTCTCVRWSWSLWLHQLALLPHHSFSVCGLGTIYTSVCWRILYWLIFLMYTFYSGASLTNTSQWWPPRLITWSLDTVPIEPPLVQYLRILPNSDTSLFHKWTGFLLPLVRGLYKIHLIMHTLACLSRKIVHCHWLIQQLDIMVALVHILLASG